MKPDNLNYDETRNEITIGLFAKAYEFLKIISSAKSRNDGYLDDSLEVWGGVGRIANLDLIDEEI